MKMFSFLTFCIYSNYNEVFIGPQMCFFFKKPNLGITDTELYAGSNYCKRLSKMHLNTSWGRKNLWKNCNNENFTIFATIIACTFLRQNFFKSFWNRHKILLFRYPQIFARKIVGLFWQYLTLWIHMLKSRPFPSIFHEVKKPFLANIY